MMYLGAYSSVCEVCVWLFDIFFKCKIYKLLSKFSLRFRDASSYICYICAILSSESGMKTIIKLYS